MDIFNKNPLDNFPSIKKDKKPNFYVEDPNEDEKKLDRLFNKNPINSFPTIRKDKK